MRKARKKRSDNYFNDYAARLKNHTPETGMLEVITDLSKKYTLAVVSSSVDSLIEDFLTVHGVRTCFQEIMGSDTHKNKTTKILRLLEKYNVAPNEAIMITDTLGDIREAEAAGVKAIAVAWGFHAEETLQRGNPLLIVTDPNQIVGAIESYFTK
jgi:phosphoglycolate phosphatase